MEVSSSTALSAQSIFVRYVMFAVIAGVCNLATQEFVVRGVSSETIMPSILAGTAVGFFIKYFLDKRFVFFDLCHGHVAEMRKIIVYGVFSVVTTMLFWAIELGSWHAFQTDESKYFGAVIGLSLGNWIKYLLDKHYVFDGGAR